VFKEQHSGSSSDGRALGVELIEEDPEDSPWNVVSSVGTTHSWAVTSGSCWVGCESKNVDIFVLCTEGGDEYVVNGGDGSFACV
jgi:hypothetical protein